MPIAFEQVNYIYAPKTPFEYEALKRIDLAIELNKITAIIGPTGSGKSTLVQHLNALLLPSAGTVYVLDREIVANQKNKDLKSLRKKVGLVFQFPEYQLFEETIIKDVMFGPLNFKVGEEEARQKAMKALAMVGLDPSYYERSPLDISGGQKRRVAIAGILAIDPDVLVLDEPTAGLDPQGAKSMMELFLDLNRNHHKTILIVTHDMDHVLNYCDNVVVMKKGEILTHQQVNDFFFKGEDVLDIEMALPQRLKFTEALRAKGFKLTDKIRNVQELALSIKKEISHE
jgi:energy-coupling factor transport system ATP-binding protein